MTSSIDFGRFGGDVVHAVNSYDFRWGGMPAFPAYLLSDKLFTASARHWYATQWRMLTRRLRYPGSRKARNAYRRLCVHWLKGDVDAALAGDLR